MRGDAGIVEDAAGRRRTGRAAQAGTALACSAQAHQRARLPVKIIGWIILIIFLIGLAVVLGIGGLIF